MKFTTKIKSEIKKDDFIWHIIMNIKKKLWVEFGSSFDIGSFVVVYKIFIHLNFLLLLLLLTQWKFKFNSINAFFLRAVYFFYIFFSKFSKASSYNYRNHHQNILMVHFIIGHIKLYTICFYLFFLLLLLWFQLQQKWILYLYV